MADHEQKSASTMKPKSVTKPRAKASRSASKKKVAMPKRRGPGRPKGSKNKAAGATAKKTGARMRRTRYEPVEREKILVVASAEGLTAAQVQKRFGVSTVTYYSWRKKAGGKAKRGRPAAAARLNDGDLGQQLRSEVQGRIRELLPAIVRAEVASYLETTFGRRRPGRPRN
jgi:transposase